jgi:hypothetical protein
VRALWAVGWALCASCVSRLDLADLDRTERSLEARTVALERDYTLWSPFTLAQTREWVALVDEELAASRALLCPSSSQRPLLVLVPVEGLAPQFEDAGDSLRLTPPTGHPLHGVEGRSIDDQILVYVTPDRVLQEDSRPVVSHRAAGNYRSTLRHELAHVHAFAAGLDGADWFSEGLADLVASYELVQGILVDRGPRVRDVLAVRSVPSESWSAARLLDWREEFERVVSGAEPVDKVSRSLCGLFMRFLVERAPGVTLVERLRLVEVLTRAELQSLDSQWRAWLSKEISRVEAGVSGSESATAAKEQPDGASLVELALDQVPLDAGEREVVPFERIGPLERGSR